MAVQVCLLSPWLCGFDWGSLHQLLRLLQLLEKGSRCSYQLGNLVVPKLLPKKPLARPKTNRPYTSPQKTTMTIVKKRQENNSIKHS